MRESDVFSIFKLPVIILILNTALLGHSSAQVGLVQKGKASYYHNKFHGRRTSSGERLNQKELTAAHRRFLFNTIVRVTNLNNDRSVIVRINDRGPYKYKNRVIDLTHAAAQKIGLLKKGLAPVKIEVIGEDGEVNNSGKHAFIPGVIENGKCYNFRGEERSPIGYGIQVAAFHELTNARYYAHVLFREGFGEVVIKVGTLDNLPVYKIIVGDFHSKIKCMKFIPKLKKKDFPGFLVKY